MSAILARASQYVGETLRIAVEHTGEHAALVIADERTELSRLLLRAYRECLPEARVLSFDETEPGAVKGALDALGARDLAVLIQSSAFRIPGLRIRVELFRRAIKVIEHANLERMAEGEIEHYVTALAYDPAYYRGVGHALKRRIDAARSARLESDGEVLRFDSALEEATLNVGDYAGLTNVGGLFPIGEVFTEARVLENVDGRVKIYGFTDTSFRLNVPREPITLVIERGRVVEALHSTAELDEVLRVIQAADGEVRVRELGFGMNRAFSRERRVADVGAFERVCGVHLSLGSRHGVYKKPHLNHREVRFHVDSFVVTDRVLLDDEVVYSDGGWHVGLPDTQT
jgi:aminopeptidase